jgi:uncharacterized protein YuzE
LKIEYSKQIDAAYIYLAFPIEPGGAKKTHTCDPHAVGGMINLDFDGEGRLIGIEILDASHLLPKEVLKSQRALA